MYNSKVDSEYWLPHLT